MAIDPGQRATHRDDERDRREREREIDLPCVRAGRKPEGAHIVVNYRETDRALCAGIDRRKPGGGDRLRDIVADGHEYGDSSKASQHTRRLLHGDRGERKKRRWCPNGDRRFGS